MCVWVLVFSFIFLLPCFLNLIVLLLKFIWHFMGCVTTWISLFDSHNQNCVDVEIHVVCLWGFSWWCESCSWPKMPKTPLHHSPCENFCQSLFSLFFFLLLVSWQIWWITQSSSEMWPFVAIFITARLENFWLLATGFLFVFAHFLSLHHRLRFEPIRLDLLNLGGLHAHCETLLWHSHFFWAASGSCY